VAYPAGIAGVVVGQGDTFDEALHDVQSALRFHIETFGRESLAAEFAYPPVRRIHLPD
jgi:predicted RNase H-like HicB family nuclease